MPTQPMQIDDSIRRLSALGLSTRRMARRLGVAQSTIVRHTQKINTGPNPILEDGYRPPRRRRVSLRIPAATAALAVAIILLATMAAVVLMARYGNAAAAKPGPVLVCVRYAQDGDITGFAPGGSCPAGWKTVTLMPGQ